jgi:hypothetical protein
MSCIFIAVPIVVATGGFPMLLAAAVSVGAAIGYRKLAAVGQFQEKSTMTEVEVAMDQSKIISDTMAEDEKVVLRRGDIEVEFYKDPRGHLGVCVRGEGVDKKTLRQTGEELIGRIRQQYAYQKIMTEMEKRGYTVQTEEATEDRRIKIRLQRMG